MDLEPVNAAREAQAMGRLGPHPQIVTLLDLGEHEGHPFMVTELMSGGDVEGVMAILLRGHSEQCFQ